MYLSRSGQRFSVGGHAFYPIAVGDATEAKFDLAIHEMNDPNIWNVPKAWLVRNYFMWLSNLYGENIVPIIWPPVWNQKFALIIRLVCIMSICHNPTQPQHELELDLIMGRKPPTHHHHTGTFKALPGNLGSWFSVCNLILTQVEEIWRRRKNWGPSKKTQLPDNLGSWCNLIKPN